MSPVSPSLNLLYPTQQILALPTENAVDWVSELCSWRDAGQIIYVSHRNVWTTVGRYYGGRVYRSVFGSSVFFSADSSLLSSRSTNSHTTRKVFRIYFSFIAHKICCFAIYKPKSTRRKLQSPAIAVDWIGVYSRDTEPRANNHAPSHGTGLRDDEAQSIRGLHLKCTELGNTRKAQKRLLSRILGKLKQPNNLIIQYFYDKFRSE